MGEAEGARGRPLRVLVTGASGFVGGALLARLRSDPSYEAIGVGRRPLDRPGYRVVDLSADEDVLRGSLAALWPAGRDPDVIVHAAARSSPWGTRAEFHRDNVATTRALMGYASSVPAAPPRIVFVSTASVLYRSSDQRDLPGGALAQPPFVNGYAASKAEAEAVVRGYRGEWVILRPRAVFGVGDTTLYPRIAAAARAGRLPRMRPPQSAALPVLSDLVHIDTLVEYLVRSLDTPGISGTTMAVTNGEPVDLQAVVMRLLERAGIPEPVRTVPRGAVLAAAGATEIAWRLSGRSSEPPITRYSVIAYAFAKTFDDPELRRLLGEPAVTLADGLESFARSIEPLARIRPAVGT